MLANSLAGNRRNRRKRQAAIVAFPVPEEGGGSPIRTPPVSTVILGREEKGPNWGSGGIYLVSHRSKRRSNDFIARCDCARGRKIDPQ